MLVHKNTSYIHIFNILGLDSSAFLLKYPVFRICIEDDFKSVIGRIGQIQSKISERFNVGRTRDQNTHSAQHIFLATMLYVGTY